MAGLLDNAAAEIRRQAAKGARDEVAPMVKLAIGLSLLALFLSSRRGR